MNCRWAILLDRIRCIQCGRELPIAAGRPVVPCGIKETSPQARPGLGDMVAAGLSAVGITEERVSRVLGKPCGCKKRAAALNELGRKLGIG